MTDADIKDFYNCIQDNEMQEVRAVGAHFTWTNNQYGGNRICSNIDGCFANIQWMAENTSVVVERIEKGISDHYPSC